MNSYRRSDMAEAGKFRAAAETEAEVGLGQTGASVTTEDRAAYSAPLLTRDTEPDEVVRAARNSESRAGYIIDIPANCERMALAAIAAQQKDAPDATGTDGGGSVDAPEPQVEAATGLCEVLRRLVSRYQLDDEGLVAIGIKIALQKAEPFEARLRAAEKRVRELEVHLREAVERAMDLEHARDEAGKAIDGQHAEIKTLRARAEAAEKRVADLEYRLSVKGRAREWEEEVVTLHTRLAELEAVCRECLDEDNCLVCSPRMMELLS